MELSSPHNTILKSIRRAVSRGMAMDCGCVVAEGPHLLAEALAPGSAWIVKRIFTTPAARLQHAALLESAEIEPTQVSARAFRSVASTETTQEILALLQPRKWSWSELLKDPGVVVLLDAIQDPGNAGAIVRSAEAFGAAGLVFLQGCARTTNGKLLRATAGSIFRLPFVEGIERAEALTRLDSDGRALYALASNSGRPISRANFRNRSSLAVGSEGHGISEEILLRAEAVSVPTHRVESLNAAVACSIALFEAARQRGLA